MNYTVTSGFTRIVVTGLTNEERTAFTEYLRINSLASIGPVAVIHPGSETLGTIDAFYTNHAAELISTWLKENVPGETKVA